MINASCISIKLWHLAHIETRKRKAVSELMICSARYLQLDRYVLFPLMIMNERNVYE
jgi:hypothetical protein